MKAARALLCLGIVAGYITAGWAADEKKISIGISQIVEHPALDARGGDSSMLSGTEGMSRTKT